MRKAGEAHVEVDMIPMIDIISLLLMFLIMVGNISETTSSVKMQLPRDMDQAKTESELNLSLQGRLIVQLVPETETRYRAVINNRSYELISGGVQKTLADYLNDQISLGIRLNHCRRDEKGIVDLPVKLRIPEAAPMTEVEKAIVTLSQLGLVNIQYAAEPVKRQ